MDVIDEEKRNGILKATLKWFDGTKGFGFVVPEGTETDCFLHVTTLQKLGVHILGPGAVLTCTVVKGDKGFQVQNVEEILHRGEIPESAVTSNGETAKLTGRVKWYDPVRGFGFIVPDDGLKDIFVHKTCLEKSDLEELEAGQRVSVVLKAVSKGREATSVKLIEDESAPQSLSSRARKKSPSYMSFMNATPQRNGEGAQNGYAQ